MAVQLTVAVPYPTTGGEDTPRWGIVCPVHPTYGGGNTPTDTERCCAVAFAEAAQCAHPSHNDYPTGSADGMSFISNRWVYTGAEGYRVKTDTDDAHLYMVVRYNAAGQTPFYGGRGLTEGAAHALAASLAGPRTRG